MNQPVVVNEHSCSCLAGCLKGAHALVVAVLDEAGRLVEANQGFRRSVGLAEAADLPVACGQYFLAPTLAELLEVGHGADGLVFEGILNIGDPTRACLSLLGSAHRQCGRLLVVAEPDVAELEGLHVKLLALNEQLAEAQRELLRVNRRLRDSEARLQDLSLSDSVTGLANRRRMEARIQEELLRSRRFGKPFAVILADIDHFKRVNDEYGHDLGDSVLRAVAGLLAREVRDCDLAARWGGEEFVVLLPETTLATAIAVAERLRAGLAGLGLAQPAWPVTASFGVAVYVAEEDGPGLIRRADGAMYAAKRGGRNRVVAALSS
ncbi:MAG: diguanylate cyclase [Thiobacillus sp.]|nr:diguanylate cyclase [Thiobacillus sp.]